MQTKTELHTHLMGMLSAEKFLDLIEKYVDKIYWPLDFIDREKTMIISIKELRKNKKLYSKAIKMLSIPLGRTIEYNKMNDYYHVRTQILNFLADFLEKKAKRMPDYQECNRWKYKGEIYNDYINLALSELVEQNVKYVEISYSIKQAMENFKLDEDLKDKIKIKFLISTDRSNCLSKVKETCKYLRKLMNDGIAVGFDFMGFEMPLSIVELDDCDESGSSRSFPQKLKTVLETLHVNKNTTLRIHAGETEDSAGNPEKILEIIQAFAKKKKINIPPPFIRIGHGIHFVKTNSYLRLLKELQCVIEINATSNYALSNISDFKELPYQYYLSNGIPVVVSTDGHGLYNTTIIHEDKIARNNLDDDLYKGLIEIDEEILETKTKELVWVL